LTVNVGQGQRVGSAPNRLLRPVRANVPSAPPANTAANSR
jgi:hypothetical protein